MPLTPAPSALTAPLPASHSHALRIGSARQPKDCVSTPGEFGRRGSSVRFARGYAPASLEVDGSAGQSSRRQSILSLGAGCVDGVLESCEPLGCVTDGCPADGWDGQSWSRRGLMIFLAAVSLEACWPSRAAELQFREFSSPGQLYHLAVPETWEKVDKAGADALFKDPVRPSTTVGVTVSPSRIKVLEEFGDLEGVGEKLLMAERNKDGFLDVQMLEESRRSGEQGGVLYTYDYRVDSIRGKKRIVTAVSIYNSKLYIVNGNYKCEDEKCDSGDSVRLLRYAVDSFDVGVTL